MSEKTFFFTIVSINILMYILGFGIAYAKKQNMTFYITLLVIESALILFWIAGNIHSEGASRGDAAGSGMAEGFYWLIFVAILIIFTLILAVTIVIRLNSPTVWTALIAAPFVLVALYGIYRIDFMSIYLQMLPVTNESTLVWNDKGIACDKNGKPFTGRAKSHAEDVFFTYNCILRGLSPDETPWMISNYKDGIVEGVVKYYVKSRKDELGIWHHRPTRTRYFGYMHVENGKANGETLMNIPDDYNYFPCWKAQYVNGKQVWHKQLCDAQEEWAKNREGKEPTWEDF